MAINLKFDLTGNPEPPSIVLANRNGNKLGQLNVNVESIDVSDKFNAASEFSFTLNKYIDDELTPLWDKVKDFKLVYCPEWDLWFEIKVELDETTETVKTVFCTQLGQAELSQIMVYNIHINEENDPNWDANNETYKSTILYDSQNTDVSLLHRLLKDKAPHYSIAYVDESIQRIQKTFSFDDTSICDAFDEIAEEIGCLFVYNSNSTKGGKPSRTISVYDLQQNCNDCGYRGEFTDKCPKCGSTNIKYGYGEDTAIFVTSDELATEGIQLVTDTDSVKNCFKLEGGDDLMTATIRNCNPNGSDYIWYFSDALKEDMSKELVEKLESYDEEYERYYKTEPYDLNGDSVNQYNELVDRYSNFYNTKTTCLNCGTEGYFYDQCPNSSCESKNLLTGKELQTIGTTITGYPNLMTAYYNTIDLLLYLESGLMPNVEIGEKSLCLDCNHEGVFAKVCPKCNSTNILSGAKYQLYLLNTLFPSTVAVNVDKVKDVTLPTANSAVLSMAKTIVKSTYKVEVLDGSSLENRESDNDGNVLSKTWKGKFKITNYSDENDVATSGKENETILNKEIEVIVNNDTKKFVEQKIEKALNKENTDDYSVTGLFAKELNVNESGEHILDENGVCQGAEILNENGKPVCPFCAEIKKYALNPLVNFSKVCDGVISILTEQGIGDDGSNIVVNNEDDKLEKAEKKALYDKLYKPYYEKQQAINKEIAIRESDIAIIEGVWDKSDENNPKCTTWGLQQYIEDRQQYIQEKLDFEKHLGEKLWLEFCAYRREDKYSNNNYVSDGLNNAELFDRALEFIEVAEEEIFKSAELQHSISATLNNLLSLPKFKPLLKSFKTGNWIRVQVDDKVYKLRLLEYGFGYGDSESISVEFSDVTKIKNGVTDVKEVLEQASSMASSYDSVQRQAEKGNVARSTIDQWLVDGLNAANMQIASNDSEEVLLTKNGLLARSYDDITGTYSPEQLKITHNIMAYTDDNWKTVKQSIGKHGYKYFDKDENKFVDETGYGMNADFVVAGIVSGSQMIGGDIYSDNYSVTDRTGSYLNLRDGTFSFGGGALRFEGGELLISSPNVVTKNEVTTINEEYLKTTSVYAENLKVNAAHIQEKLTAGQINTKGLIAENISSTTIDGKTITGGSILIGDTTKVNDYAEITNDGALTCTNVNIQGGILQIGSKNNEETHTWISTDGTLNTYNANISGEIRAAKGQIGGFTIEPTKTEEGVVKPGGWLYSGELQEGQDTVQIGDDKSIFLSATNMRGTMPFYNLVERIDEDGNTVYDENNEAIYDVTQSDLEMEDWRITVGTNFGVTSDGTAYMSNCEIVGGSLRMGTASDGYHTWISEDGVLNAEGVNISGEMHVSSNSTIAGWSITENGIEKKDDNDNPIVGMSSGDISYASLIEKNITSPIRFYAGGQTKTVTVEETTVSDPQTFTYSPEDCETILNATYFISNGGGGGSFSGIDTDTLTFVWSGSVGATLTITYTYAILPTFIVLEDGSLHSTTANISGTINATDGFIGGLKIDNGVKGYDGEVESFSLTSDGLSIKNSLAKIQVGNLETYYDDENKNTYWQTHGALYIQGVESGVPVTSIELMTDKTDDNLINCDISLCVGEVTEVSIYKENIEIKLKSNYALYYPVTYTIYYQFTDGVLIGQHSYDDSIMYSVDLTIEANQTESAIKKITTEGSGMSARFIRFKCFGEWLNDDKINEDLIDQTIGTIDSFTQKLTNKNILITGNILPKETEVYSLGNKDMLWSAIYAQTGTIQTSDKNKKNNIKNLSCHYTTIFDNLNPVSYKLNNNTSNRTHIGLIAQDVKDAIVNTGLTTQDFAGYCEWENDDGTIGCGLRYEEFIALCINEIQKLKRRVTELENK